MRPGIQNLKTALRVSAGGAQQVIGNIVAGFGSIETETAIGRAYITLIHLVIAELAAKLHGVPAIDFREAIREMPGVVRLKRGERGAADTEIDERERRQAFVARRPGRNDAERANSGDEPEVRDLAEPGRRLVRNHGGASKTEVCLVHGCRPENLGIAQDR